MQTLLEYTAFCGSMVCSILYGKEGRAGPIAGLFVAIAFMAYGYVSGAYAAIISNVFFLAIHGRNLKLINDKRSNRKMKEYAKSVKALMAAAHATEVKMGWNEPDYTDRFAEPFTTELRHLYFTRFTSLVHSEVSEAVEADRKGLMDKNLVDRPAVEVELADAVIRILGFAEGRGYDLSGAIIEKMMFNENRPDHDPAKRSAPGAKQY